MDPHRTILGSLCWVFDQQRILMLKRNKFPNQGLWGAIGGRIEVGESPLECVIREVQEETGLIIENPDLRGIVSVSNLDLPQHWILFIYVAVNPLGTLITTTEGKLGWVPMPVPKDFPMARTDHLFLDEAIKSDNCVFQAKVIYDSQSRFEAVVHRPTKGLAVTS